MARYAIKLIATVAVSFLITAVGGTVLIPFLRRLRCGQTVRTDGPESHLKKDGTPTMGGILILFGAFGASAMFFREYPKTAVVLLFMAAFGGIGFVDDYIKVVCRRSLGLRAWQKLFLQLFVTAAFACYLERSSLTFRLMRIPGIEGSWIDFGRGSLFLLFFIVLGTVNGVNLTDGLDGLAGSVTTIVAVFFTVLAIGRGSEIAPAGCAVVGALFGFLLFNSHPACVFMGDTGSLALGGFVAVCGYLLEMPLYIAVVGVVYLVETASVIAQVLFFKISGGKKLLRMAPLHHHFELCGWSERKIVFLFTVITALMCLSALLQN